MVSLTIIETTTSTASKTNEPASDDHIDDKYLDTWVLDDSSPALRFPNEKSLDGSPPVLAKLRIVKSKPITAKIRTTMQHLRAQAGRWSGFRGIVLAMIIHLLRSAMWDVTEKLFGTSLCRVIAYALLSVLLAGLDLTWTHIVISAPSTRLWWWRRIPSIDRVKVTIIPTIIFGIAEYASHLPPSLLARAFSLRSYNYGRYSFDAGANSQIEVIAKCVLVGLVALISRILIMMPATIALRRVQASMLPDEDEAIVPFDRTFGGKVQPMITGGSGAVSMADALRTFDWSARIRYLKVQLKVMALKVTAPVIFLLILSGETLVFNKVGNQVMKNWDLKVSKIAPGFRAGD